MLLLFQSVLHIELNHQPEMVSNNKKKPGFLSGFTNLCYSSVCRLITVFCVINPQNSESAQDKYSMSKLKKKYYKKNIMAFILGLLSNQFWLKNPQIHHFNESFLNTWGINSSQAAVQLFSANGNGLLLSLLLLFKLVLFLQWFSHTRAGMSN